MDARGLRYFLAVAKHLNFGRAAEALRTAQPALSQHIRKLEEEVGGPLFERTKRYVALTPLGTELLPSAQSIIDELEQLTARLKDRAKTPSGKLRIGTIAPATMGVLPRLLPSYRQKFPNVQLSLSTVGLDDQIRALVERRIDVGVLRGPVDTDVIAAMPIADEYFCVMMSEHHRLAKLETVRVEDLDGETIIGLERERAGSFNNHVDRLFRSHGVQSTQFVETTDVPAVFALVAGGVGVCISSTVFCGIAVMGVTYRALLPKTEIHSMMLACRRDRRDVLAISSLFDHTSQLNLLFPPPSEENDGAGGGASGARA